ncbi:GNAT family N-acetyltransferase [Halalkalicoccus jeotgali]|uniref:N-acetyltransferase domain-containing protein n=1 Tax=Halalkalicoccus jeotgali (strain DSM 18796 / CECT 7217 / JCM 14584 / KCTC 4019 / B3) TaxID=795797 RepID=L9VFZ4_HALJB|nr:GNAT family N-acetyltransferase [Halalkalicoccus jeotgali]ELY36125.1 hypothetical protein C497_12252 [Halalkalicoccus jeotgali B3]
MAKTTTREPQADEYAFRLFEPSDEEAFVSLYDATFGGGSAEWFEWKYVENPVANYVPIVVATRDGELVGARPCVPFRMRVGDRTVEAVRFGDTMVHPDHRRRGLFTRMTQRTVEYYAALDPAFGFNHPNENSLPGYRTLGGRVVGRMPVAYRVQNPAALADGRLDGPAALGASAATPLARAYLDGLTRLTRPATPGFTITRHDSTPAETLADLYEAGPPEGIHADRTPEFYAWRFRNPQWEYRTYVAHDGKPVAGIVTGTQRTDGVTVTTLAEAVPVAGTDDRRDAFVALVGRVVEDAGDADLLAYSGRSIPEGVLAAAGFHWDDRPPLSWLARPNLLVTTELGGEVYSEWKVNGVNLLELSNWSLSFCEQDAR